MFMGCRSKNNIYSRGKSRENDLTLKNKRFLLFQGAKCAWGRHNETIKWKAVVRASFMIKLKYRTFLLKLTKFQVLLFSKFLAPTTIDKPVIDAHSSYRSECLRVNSEKNWWANSGVSYKSWIKVELVSKEQWRQIQAGDIFNRLFKTVLNQHVENFLEQTYNCTFRNFERDKHHGTTRFVT